MQNMSHEKKIIGFIGAGNMASAMLHGLIDSGFNSTNIVVYDLREELLTEWSARGVQVARSTPELNEMSDVIVVAVKPQQAEKALTRISTQQNKVLLSVMAGISVDSLQNLTNIKSISRAMPNTPALIGEGATGIYFNDAVADNDKTLIMHILSALGPQIVQVEHEMLIDAVTAISGSGPAYVYAFMEAMHASAIKLGLSDEDSLRLITQTLLGAVKLVESSAHSLSELRQQVTSPGGTTEAALHVFQELNLNATVEAALLAANDRARELAKN